MATTTESNLTPGDIRTIMADRPPSGYFFDAWTGDTSTVDNPSSIITTITIPSNDVIITATYKQFFLFTTFRANGSNMFNGMFVSPTSNPNSLIVDWGDGSSPEAYYNVTKGKEGAFGYFLAHDYTGIMGDCDIRFSQPLTGCAFMGISGDIITPPDLTGITTLGLFWATSCTLLTAPPIFTGQPMLMFLSLSNCTSITTPPDLTGLTALIHLDLSNCTSITTPPDLTGIMTLENFNMSGCTSLDTSDIDVILGYFSTQYPYCNAVQLQNTSVPTPSVLLTAQTANPQCNFYVDVL